MNGNAMILSALVGLVKHTM